MSPIWAFVIPGLAMMANEFAPAHGVVVLENPEIGSGVKIEQQYTLNDVAEMHIQTILKKLAEEKELTGQQQKLTLYGFSMGGMILSVIATKYRDQLPKDTKFIYVATTANAPDLPAIPDQTVQSWSKVKPGDFDALKEILLPFFSSEFVQKHGDVVDSYVRYRLSGKNGQSAKAYYRQVNALRSFGGTKYFSHLNPAETVFIVPQGDRFLGQAQAEKLRQLNPKAIFAYVPEMGHFMNIEQQTDPRPLPYRLDEIFGKNSNACSSYLSGANNE